MNNQVEIQNSSRWNTIFNMRIQIYKLHKPTKYDIINKSPKQGDWVSVYHVWEIGE